MSSKYQGMYSHASFVYLLNKFSDHYKVAWLPELRLVLDVIIFFQASIPDRSHYRPGWQRNPTLVKMHEKYNEGNVLNGSRIVGGTEVIPHSFPHQVAMFIDGSFFCGGSLICKQF